MCRFKGRIAGQIAGNSCSIAKICNDEAVHFSPKMHVHEWIRGSLKADGQRPGNPLRGVIGDVRRLEEQ
jgi:hypothetical protein